MSLLSSFSVPTPQVLACPRPRAGSLIPFSHQRFSSGWRSFEWLTYLIVESLSTSRIVTVTPTMTDPRQFPALPVYMLKEGWKTLCLDKKARQQNSIPKEWIVPVPPDEQLNVLDFPQESGLLTPLELEITESNVEKLLPNIARGVWSSVSVTTAFYKRAILAHHTVNCLTEIFVEKALSRASELDDHLNRTGKVVGPLHGLPVSLKDQLCIKGLETVMGYVSWINEYADRDAVLVEILYELGAVPFVRTNVPQSLMWAETFNHVFGRTTNPHNRSLTSGGSSGGEGALIALRGSPLGVGSDTGGSIRIPSAFNGLYGLRPSYNRIPYGGAKNCMEGQDSAFSVFGPMANSPYGLKVFMKAVIDAKPWRKDPLVLRKPWDDAAYDLSEHGNGHSLVFAILWDSGNVIPHPPIRRALEMTKDALLKRGHKVVDWAPYKHMELSSVLRDIWLSGLVEDVAAITALSGEPVINTMRPDMKATPPPNPDPVSAFELWKLHKRRQELRKEYLDHWEATAAWTGTGRPVDAVISPVAPFAASPHGENINAGYTSVWNSLDYPAAVFPVTKVDPALDTVEPRDDFLSKQDKEVYELYDHPATFKDAPVGLQVVGRTQEEEAVLRMCEIVDDCLKNAPK